MPYNLMYMVNGAKYDLRSYTAETGAFTLQELGLQGGGGSPMHLLTTRGPQQDGTSVTGFRLDPRTILLPLVYYATSHRQHFEARNFLSRIFTPSMVKGTLILTLPTIADDGGFTPMLDSGTRCIDVYVAAPPSFDQEVSSGYTVRTVAQLYADDPTWYDPQINSEYISSVVSGTPTAYPKVYPTTYGALTVNASTALSYIGSVVSYPVIQVTGPVSSLVITNATTGKVLSFSASVPAGRVWTIDMRYGYKTIKDDLGVNQISALSAGSSLGTWAIAPSPTVTDGINVITVTGSGATSATSVVLDYSTRYHAI
jgi:hypothetical protein